MSRSLRVVLIAFVLIAVLAVFLMGENQVTSRAAKPSVSVSVRATGEATQERLRELLLERKQLLDKRVEDMKVFVDAGRVSGSEYAKAKEEALLAGLDLCHTKAERITIRREIVELYKDAEGWAKRHADTGRAPQGELAEARVARIEAEIDLLKEQLDI